LSSWPSLRFHCFPFQSDEVLHTEYKLQLDLAMSFFCTMASEQTVLPNASCVQAPHHILDVWNLLEQQNSFILDSGDTGYVIYVYIHDYIMY